MTDELNALFDEFKTSETEDGRTEQKPDILVVDDDPSIRRGLKRVLSPKYGVIVAENGEQGIALITRALYCVILDVKMKGLDGFSTYTALKQKCPEVPIIFYTAFQSEHDLLEVINTYKPEGYVEKGHDFSLLEHLIENAVKKYRLILENETYKKELERKIENLDTANRNLEASRRVVENSPVVLFRWLPQPKWPVEFVSNNVTRLGYTKEEFLSNAVPYASIIFPDDLDRVEAEIKRFAENRVDKFKQEYRIKTKDEKVVWVEVQMAVERDAHGKIIRYQGIVTDITLRKAAEEEARLKELQLIQADKLTSLGILVSGVAHEINNPNGIIMMNVPRLSAIWESAAAILDQYYTETGDFKLGGLTYSKLLERVPQMFQQTIEGAQRIKGIVRELKDFASPDISNMSEHVDLKKVIQTAVDLVSNKIKHSTDHFDLTLCNADLFVQGSFQKLEQVFINLFINACEALTRKEQRIDVTLSHDNKENTAVIRIRDDGAGIAEADLNHIFDPFFTTKREKGGTGLGLSLTHGIIMDHRGRITFDSKVGYGTCCIVTLPLAPNHLESDHKETN